MLIFSLQESKDLEPSSQSKISHVNIVDIGFKISNFLEPLIFLQLSSEIWYISCIFQTAYHISPLNCIIFLNHSFLFFKLRIERLRAEIEAPSLTGSQREPSAGGCQSKIKINLTPELICGRQENIKNCHF